eukprot:964941_1
MVKFPKYLTTILNLLVLLQLFGYTQAAQDVDNDDLLANGYSHENESELTDSIPDEVKKEKYDFMESEENTATEDQPDLNVHSELEVQAGDGRWYMGRVIAISADKSSVKIQYIKYPKIAPVWVKPDRLASKGTRGVKWVSKKMIRRIANCVPVCGLYVPVYPNCSNKTSVFQCVPNYASFDHTTFEATVSPEKVNCIVCDESPRPIRDTKLTLLESRQLLYKECMKYKEDLQLIIAEDPKAFETKNIIHTFIKTSDGKLFYSNWEMPKNLNEPTRWKSFPIFEPM